MSCELENNSRKLIERYYSAFNRGDWAGMLELLDDRVAHDPAQGEREIGRDRFQAFLQARARCYLEVLTDVHILIGKDGSRAAAEYVVSGQYLTTEPGMPLARGQRYRLSGGAFFAIADGRITRISHCCNLADWVAQLSQDG
jgi:steroid delta-isomerase-like uncharacterized protein